MKKIFLAVIGLLLNLSCFSQNITFYGFIPSYSQTGLINRRFDYEFFASFTNTQFSRTIAEVYYPVKILQVYVQPSIIYKFSSNLNFAASLTYNYQRNNPDAPYVKEWRPWQQVVFSHNIFTRGRLSHRVRFEQRFQDNTLTNIRTFTTRLRYQIGYMMPLQGKTLDPKEFYVNAYNEFYFSLSNAPNNPRAAFYGENWSYIGVGYNTDKWGRIEIGPLYQAAYRDLQKDRRNLGLIQVLWVTNFDLKLKKKPKS